MAYKLVEHKTFNTLPVDFVNNGKKLDRDYKTIRVSELIKSPLERWLMFEHMKDEVDTSDGTKIKTMFGTIFHAGLELLDKSIRKDKRLYLEMNGWTITGEYDYFDEERGLLIDYKTTSKKLFEYYRLEDFKSYYWQLQIYRWMIEKVMQKEVKQLMNIVFILDGDERSGFIYTIEYELLPLEAVEKQVEFFLQRHDRIEPCNDEERWARTRYKVGEKTFSNWVEALLYSKQTGEPIEEEKFYIKCKYFCKVAKYCPLYNSTQKNQP